MSRTADIQPGQNENNPPPNFTNVFEAYQRPVYNYLLRMTQDQTDAEDLTQETFVRVHDGLLGFRAEASLATWVYRIATNISLDHFRRRSTAQDEVTRSPEAVETDQESLADREVGDVGLVLHGLRGMRNGEIADVLGVSLDTVKIRLHRARTKLRPARNSGCAFAHDERDVLVCEQKQGDGQVGE